MVFLNTASITNSGKALIILFKKGFIISTFFRNIACFSVHDLTCLLDILATIMLISSDTRILCHYLLVVYVKENIINKINQQKM